MLFEHLPDVLVRERGHRRRDRRSDSTSSGHRRCTIDELAPANRRRRSLAEELATDAMLGSPADAFVHSRSSATAAFMN